MAFSVVIPSRNAENLVPCVRAIRDADETCRIIVVDDGIVWPGDLCKYLDAMTYQGVAFVHGVKPFCFARNVNIGIAASGDDDVIVLNDDALLKTPQGFSLLASCVRGSGYGLVASACNTVGNENQFRRSNDRIRDEPRMVCFVCVYIPRSTINMLIDLDGYALDERFVGYGLDDDDFCLRVRNAGLKLGVFDGCFVDHSSLTSSFRGAAGAGGNFDSNLALFIEKWGFDNRGLGYDQSPWQKLWRLEE